MTKNGKLIPLIFGRAAPEDLFAGGGSDAFPTTHHILPLRPMLGNELELKLSHTKTRSRQAQAFERMACVFGPFGKLGLVGLLQNNCFSAAGSSDELYHLDSAGAPAKVYLPVP